MKTLENLTETKNVFINLLVGSTLLLIAAALTALIVGCIVDPSLIENASF